jgi:hypothetical protein
MAGGEVAGRKFSKLWFLCRAYFLGIRTPGIEAAARGRVYHARDFSMERRCFYLLIGVKAWN